jgi:hypothetical protein
MVLLAISTPASPKAFQEADAPLAAEPGVRPKR